MDVMRVHHRGGSWIEPALDHSWPEKQKLQWKAAVVAADTGLFVTVEQINDQSSAAPLYAVRIGESGHMARPYSRAWDLLSGVAVGAAEMANKTAQQMTREVTGG